MQLIKRPAFCLLNISLLYLLSYSAHAALILDQNRVVFPASEMKVTIVKVDNPTESDFLMQSWVEDKEGKEQEDLFVDPPLAKIKSRHKVALRITTINPNIADKNEEQLYWLNVKEIPKLENGRTQPRLAIVMRTRVKVLYRPKSVPVRMDKEYSRLEWKHIATGLVIHNPTPYYITFNKVWSGRSEAEGIDIDMVAPNSDLTVSGKTAAIAKQVSFNIIDDFGDTSDTYTAKVN